MTTFVIAIVGCGPRGMYALDRLSSSLPEVPSHSVEILVFEPHRWTGAGPHYDPEQPDHLRMNFSNRLIDAWVPGDANVEHRSFRAWGDRLRLGLDPHGYAPRATVGRYLSDCFDLVMAELSDRADVHVIAERVEGVDRVGDRWRVSAETESLMADEVLLSTGHSLRTNRRAEGGVASVFPTSDPAGLQSISSGSTVAIRGLGLTFIDACLELTEGRGGVFGRADSGGVEYTPPGDDDIRIVAYSRTGRPMTPKADEAVVPAPEVTIATSAISRSLASGNGPLASSDVIRSLTDLAGAILDSGPRCRAHSRDDLARTLQDVLHPEPVSPVRPVVQMRADLLWATGRAGVGGVWAYGWAWRLLYPTLVSLVAHRRMDADWSSFADLGRAMERIAFGPPVENAEKMLALVDAGVLDLSLASNPTVSGHGTGGTLRLGDASVGFDVFVDAVLPSAGHVPGRTALYDRLFDRGHLSERNGGVHTTLAGRCIGSTGRPTTGLSAIGRLTEGSTLGNDTLSRTLHPQPDRWAAMVARRAKRELELTRSIDAESGRR